MYHGIGDHESHVLDNLLPTEVDLKYPTGYLGGPSPPVDGILIPLVSFGSDRIPDHLGIFVPVGVLWSYSYHFCCLTLRSDPLDIRPL